MVRQEMQSFFEKLATELKAMHLNSNDGGAPDSEKSKLADLIRHHGAPNLMTWLKTL